MAKPKTTWTNKSVAAFIKAVPDLVKQQDSFRLIEIMKKLSGHEPEMWGPSIIGFGSYHYKYESGHEGDAPLVGFSPRKAAFSLYLSLPAEKRKEFLKIFGKHTTAKYCIYFKKLEDINLGILEKMVSTSLKYLKTTDNPRC